MSDLFSNAKEYIKVNLASTSLLLGAAEVDFMETLEPP